MQYKSKIEFHDLGTHTQQTCYQTGRSQKMCRNILGHSDVSTTMNAYAHATRQAKRDSAKLLDKVVGKN